jgi:hypothetical protein
LIRFTLSLVISSLVICGLTIAFQNVGYIDTFPTYFWITLAFLNLSTIMIYFYLIRASSNTFVQGYLLTMVGKLFAYFAYNIVIILLDRGNAGINVGFFLITYLVFTVLELTFLYRRMGR